MIDELFVYGRQKTGLFKQIIDQSSVIHTYHVSPNLGQDLNTNNLETYLKDPAFGVTTVTQKYPICVCMTPKSRFIMLNGMRTEQFKFQLFFLTRTNYDATNKLKRPDKDANVSTVTTPDDWSVMKQEALLFINLLEATLRGTVMIDAQPVQFRTVINIDASGMDIRRLSNYQNDRISGVELSFVLYLSTDICIISSSGIFEVARYQEEIDPIWNADKTNYYTRNQVDLLLGVGSFSKTLDSGDSFTIPLSEHEITNPKGITLLDTDKAESDVYFRLNDDKSVYIESTINLLNYKLIIF